MKKVCVVGHFGFGENLLNGQTIKTKIITDELEKHIGKEQVEKIDTHGGIKMLPKIVFQLIEAFIFCKNIIILPASNGIRVFAPLCTMLNLFFHRQLYYVVIGGWLNDLLKHNHKIEKCLKNFSGIFVETEVMKNSLNIRGFDNVQVMPNFKNLTILGQEELVYATQEPFKLCTFSRIMREKGIAEAVEAVKLFNLEAGRTVFELDIYGQIDSEQIAWFDELRESFPNEINYKGIVAFDKSVDILKEYYGLLFPTYYSGEGFAGTLLDAMAAGVPVVVSDWKYNNEIVSSEKTGLLIEPKNVNQLKNILYRISNDVAGWNSMKINCIKEAKKYTPENVILVLLTCLK